MLDRVVDIVGKHLVASDSFVDFSSGNNELASRLHQVRREWLTLEPRPSHFANVLLPHGMHVTVQVFRQMYNKDLPRLSFDIVPPEHAEGLQLFWQINWFCVHSVPKDAVIGFKYEGPPVVLSSE